MIHAETNRLILREFQEEDSNGIWELDSNPEVHRYLGNKPLSNRSQADKIVTMIRSQYKEYGIGRWAVLDKSNQRFIGWCGLKWVTDEIGGRKDYYDLGYRFIPEYWNKGIATESSKAVITYGFKTLDLKELIAIAVVENIASNKVIKKLGFTLSSQFMHDGYMHNGYSLLKDNYLE